KITAHYIFIDAIHVKQFIFLLLFFSQGLFAQQKYWVTFIDKNGTIFNPREYFDDRTIRQRMQYGIPLSDSSDFPVNEKYLEEINKNVSSSSYASRWLNGVAVMATEKQIEHVREFAFVKDAEEMNAQ